ncbi:M23 family metallopeptidase [Corynebacterium frankenforstense]|uniref:M23 family metallopeptidase n=1 Tax=Corynebacterium frankenforstense TaxID=1230998 RepID=UPI002551A8AF|nr:M23 family metallopeptidase [Corynebacterium frankenforstense]MDK6260255.1 M23 family metallopeptidase [Corynebacterium frankenforstense]
MGRHRKITSAQTTKGRIALVAATAGTVSTAGIGGAAAATMQNPAEQDAHSYELAADAATIDDATAAEAAPQILNISEFKPASDIQDQLGKAVAFNDERMAADAAARMPQIIKPAVGSFTSGFGARWGTVHNGVDIANALGTPIVAAMDGVVIDAGPASGFGNWVRIKHEDGTITVYGHMSTIDVTVGQQVTAGTKIAGMGSEGFSTGSHLHFEVHPAGGGPIDPLPWLAERGITL